MKKSTVTLLVVLGVAGVIVVTGLVVTLGRFIVQSVTPTTSTAAGKRLVIDAATLIAHGAEADPDCGSHTTTRPFGLTTHVQYECKSDSLYVLSFAEVSPTATEARHSFSVNVGGQRLGVAMGSQVTLQRRDDLLGDLGDDRFGAIIRSNAGKAIGNIFVVRQGRIVHSAMFSGIYFDDPEAVGDLIAPLLREGTEQYGGKK